jgi:hypothetical protein
MRNDFSHPKNLGERQQEEFGRDEKNTRYKRPKQECAHGNAEAPEVFGECNNEIREENNSEAIQRPANHLVFVILANEHIQFQEQLVVFTGRVDHVRKPALIAQRLKNKRMPVR